MEVKKPSDLVAKKPEQQLLRKKALEAALDQEKLSSSPSRLPQSGPKDDGADEIQKKSEGGGGAEPKADRPQGAEAAPVLSPTAAAAAKAAAAGLVTDLQKKLLRAERFGMPVQLSEEEKRSSRAERYIGGANCLEAVRCVDAFTREGFHSDSKPSDSEKFEDRGLDASGQTSYARKGDCRSEVDARNLEICGSEPPRFGTGSSLPGKSEELKRKERAERFKLGSDDEEAKKRARLERFGQDKSSSLEEEKRKARAERFAKGTSSAPSQTNGKVNSTLKTMLLNLLQPIKQLCGVACSKGGDEFAAGGEKIKLWVGME
ncbi:hypothetical protein Taro_024547 [Colocasia esculenta]|uniref:THO1-MOS11 C-terminal domain-containing protein n=1 Tax=Colocasia esculenta TaxID=4460 RepID=A0A843V9N9_COLES|nr:hypothetical protein [Colocasia esculenta]